MTIKFRHVEELEELGFILKSESDREELDRIMLFYHIDECLMLDTEEERIYFNELYVADVINYNQ